MLAVVCEAMQTPRDWREALPVSMQKWGGCELGVVQGKGRWGPQSLFFPVKSNQLTAWVVVFFFLRSWFEAFQSGWLQAPRKGLQVPSTGGPIFSPWLGREVSCPGTTLKAERSWGNHTEREAAHPAAQQFTRGMMRDSGDNPDCSYDEM